VIVSLRVENTQILFCKVLQVRSIFYFIVEKFCRGKLRGYSMQKNASELLKLTDSVELCFLYDGNSCQAAFYGI
jgi:hypothetical protein